MTIKNIILSLTLITSLLVSPTKVIAEPIEIVNPVNLTVNQQIEYFSTLYGADVSLIKAVIKCESGGVHSTVSDGGRSNGIFQFQEPSFNRMSKDFGEQLDYHSQYDQIKLGIWSIANGYGMEWTAYRTIKNGGKYSFYSTQLQRHFTVYCKI